MPHAGGLVITDNAAVVFIPDIVESPPNLGSLRLRRRAVSQKCAKLSERTAIRLLFAKPMGAMPCEAADRHGYSPAVGFWSCK